MPIRQKNIYVCVSALKKLGMVGQNIEIAFFTIFSTIFSVFDNISLTFHNKMFKVGAKA